MRVVLFEPEIPQNAGNVVRTCAVTGCALTLVEPLGFRPSNRQLKRSGLDYWLGVDVSLADDLQTLLRETNPPIACFSSRATKSYCELSYSPDHWLIFGSETKGLPDWLWKERPDTFVTLPMQPGARCLNLANTVAVAIYEAWKQLGFRDLDTISAIYSSDC